MSGLLLPLWLVVSAQELPVVGTAGEARVLPADISLDGPAACQRSQEARTAALWSRATDT